MTVLAIDQIHVSCQLEDISEAVRVAIQFVIEDKTEEKKIYTKTICSTCGGKKSKHDISIRLYHRHISFLQSIPLAYAVKDENVSCAPPQLPPHSHMIAIGDAQKALRCLLEYAEAKGDRDTIFRRCNGAGGPAATLPSKSVDQPGPKLARRARATGQRERPQ